MAAQGAASQCSRSRCAASHRRDGPRHDDDVRGGQDGLAAVRDVVRLRTERKGADNEVARTNYANYARKGADNGFARACAKCSKKSSAPSLQKGDGRAE